VGACGRRDAERVARSIIAVTTTLPALRARMVIAPAIDDVHVPHVTGAAAPGI
jgi:hypothetical protein